MSRVYDFWERLVGAVLRKGCFASSSHEDVFATRASSEVIVQKDLSGPSILSYHDVRPIDIEELRKATQNFGDWIVVGCCHHYKGWINEKTLIASKPGSGLPITVNMGMSREAWLKEIHYLSHLRHPNLIKLVGHCSKNDNYFMLVYEFMRHKNLDYHLFEINSYYQPLSWARRIKVAIDVARALSFLHDRDNPIIHRDVKPSHILFDGDLNAKLCSFDLATEMTDVQTHIVGTYGYAAPEYIATVLALLCWNYYQDVEVLTRVCLAADWATPYLWKKKRLMDPRLKGQYSSEEVYDVANVVAKCLSEDPEQRPRMAMVLVALERVHKKLLFP